MTIDKGLQLPANSHAGLPWTCNNTSAAVESHNLISPVLVVAVTSVVLVYRSWF